MFVFAWGHDEYWVESQPLGLEPQPGFVRISSHELRGLLPYMVQEARSDVERLVAELTGSRDAAAASLGELEATLARLAEMGRLQVQHRARPRHVISLDGTVEDPTPLGELVEIEPDDEIGAGGGLEPPMLPEFDDEIEPPHGLDFDDEIALPEGVEDPAAAAAG